MTTDEKLALYPGILESAMVLHKLGLIDQTPEEVIRRYKQLNPDMAKKLNELTGFSE